MNYNVFPRFEIEDKMRLEEAMPTPLFPLRTLAFRQREQL